MLSQWVCREHRLRPAASEAGDLAGHSLRQGARCWGAASPVSSSAAPLGKVAAKIPTYRGWFTAARSSGDPVCPVYKQDFFFLACRYQFTLESESEVCRGCGNADGTKLQLHPGASVCG